jgi:hypothetical protein
MIHVAGSGTAATGSLYKKSSSTTRCPYAAPSGGWLGYADFLVRVGEGCLRWAWSFEPWDAKLARSPRPEHLFQLALYGDLVGAERGAPLPDSGEDALSNGFELGLTLARGEAGGPAHHRSCRCRALHRPAAFVFSPGSSGAWLGTLGRCGQGDPPWNFRRR